MKIPDHIATIAVIDRSKPSKGWLNALEGLATGESLGQDKEGRRRAVMGVIQALSKTPRFTVRETGIELQGSQTGNSMLTPMDWREIEDICKKYNTDAVAVIEMFDSDHDIQTRRNDIKTKTKSGKDSIRTEFTADRRLNVKIGWRLYDPKEKIILDEAVTKRNNEAQRRGTTEQKARDQLPSAYRAVEDISFDAGLDYGTRIAPTWITLQRNYFTKVKGAYDADMQKAARYAEATDWMKAAEVWQSISAQKGDSDAAGKATFNMAVANECVGKLDLALEWAKTAYSEHGVKEAKNYIETLKARQNDERKVQNQLIKPKDKV